METSEAIKLIKKELTNEQIKNFKMHVSSGILYFSHNGRNFSCPLRELKSIHRALNYIRFNFESQTVTCMGKFF